VQWVATVAARLAPIFVDDIGPRKSFARGTLLNLSPRRLLSALAATSLFTRLLPGGSTFCRGNR
jgi:hypothetical protein